MINKASQLLLTSWAEDGHATIYLFVYRNLSCAGAKNIARSLLGDVGQL